MEILNTFTVVLAFHSALKNTTLVKKDPSVLALWSSAQKLNEKQCDSILSAVKKKFQLIQGPPGNW